MIINRETISLIIDVFEDFLESKGISIDNPEKEDNSNPAIIYGSDYDNLTNLLTDLMSHAGVHIPDVYDNEVTPPEPIEDLLIYVPAYDDVILITEGSGDNLTAEDEEEGYVDYLNYTIGDAEEIEEGLNGDGGMLMSDKLIREKYNSLKEAVPEVLDFVYGKSDITWVEISGGAEFNKEISNE